MSAETEALILERLAELTTEVRAQREAVRELRERVQPSHGAELTVDQAVRYTNCASRQAFYRWCKRRKVRAVSHGRYARRRLDAVMSA